MDVDWELETGSVVGFEVIWSVDSSGDGRRSSGISSIVEDDEVVGAVENVSAVGEDDEEGEVIRSPMWMGSMGSVDVGIEFVPSMADVGEVDVVIMAGSIVGSSVDGLAGVDVVVISGGMTDGSVVVVTVSVEAVGDSGDVEMGDGESTGCVSDGASWMQSSHIPGVPRSETPESIPIAVVAFSQVSPSRIMVLFIVPLEPVGGVFPSPTWLTTTPFGSIRDSRSALFESEMVVVTALGVVASTLFGSLSE